MIKFYFINSLICVLILSFKAKAQENLYKETIFIVFAGSKFEKHKKKLNSENTLGEYFFLVPENSKDPSGLYSTGVITLADKKYKDFDAKFSDSPTPKFEVHKSFLRKNKEQIFFVEEMRHMGFNKTLRMFLKAKHIFLIDKTEARNNKVTIKGVFLLNSLDGDDVELPNIIYKTKD